jgi:DNA uptake protein ComE-like DNA-binding protein
MKSHFRLIVRAGVVAVVTVLVIAAPARAQVGAPVAIIDPNIATESDLAALAGMSPAVAAQLVAERPFLRMADLDTFLAGQAIAAASRTGLYGQMFVHLNLNTASDEEIQMIPNVGARMLHEFKEYRPYVALAQFHREIAKYVDDTELARLAQYVSVPIDLNTASDEDILSIPGIGNRMLHEFKEYRPYLAMEQFRREMGKYVDDDEVARLERYVTID